MANIFSMTGYGKGEYNDEMCIRDSLYRAQIQYKTI